MASQGSGQLSVLSDLVRKRQMQKFTPKKPGYTGVTRGMTGLTGAKPFQGRNPDAGVNKEMATLQSPIMTSFMKGITPQTPIATSGLAGPIAPQPRFQTPPSILQSMKGPY